jgi:hypothetical protein
MRFGLFAARLCNGHDTALGVSVSITGCRCASQRYSVSIGIDRTTAVGLSFSFSHETRLSGAGNNRDV